MKAIGTGRELGVALGLLLFLHLLILPSWLDGGSNLAVAVGNLAALLYGLLYRRIYSSLRFAAYLAGYLLFFLLAVSFGVPAPLYGIFVLLYASFFRLPRLLFHFLLLVLALELVPEYWIPSYLLLGLLLELLHHVFTRAHSSLVGWSFLLGFLLLGTILLPVFYLMLQSSSQTLTVTFQDEEVRSALGVSLLSASITTFVVCLFGVPLGYAMARTHFWGKQLLDSLIDLPILIPQSVAGIALLVMVGPKAPLGRAMREVLGLSITSSLMGIVLAQIFVSATFLIRASMEAFSKVDPKLENVSRTLGASQLQTFFSISLPLAWRGIFAGCILTWSRAISEAGALMLLAYHPFTISILVHDRFTQFGTAEAQPVSVLLVLVCLFLFIVLNLIKYMPLGRLFVSWSRPHAETAIPRS